MKALSLALAFALPAVGAPPSISVKAPSSASRGSAVWAEVSFQIASTEPIVISGIPFVELSNASGTWWAPFQLGSGKPLQANERSSLNLQVGSSTLRINLAALKWAPSISSVWPWGPLASVPPGAYTLQFSLQGLPGVVSKSPGIHISLK